MRYFLGRKTVTVVLTLIVSYSDAADLSPERSILLSPEAVLGRELFRDETLSASGRMSCATCHDPANAFARPYGASPFALGGARLDTAGFRKVPSLRYLARTPRFSFAKKDGKAVARGGFTRDGRANSLAEQARLPLMSPQEMANTSAKELAARLSVTSYAEQFRFVFGENVFADPERAVQKALTALQRFQLEDSAQFAPFTSKYDYFLAGKVRLSAQEQRGLVLFEDPRKGNCAACHPSAPEKDGTPPLFTDFTYDNIGAPRNRSIPANSKSGYFDLGLCGPFRKDLQERKELCGAFKVPTLRNVELTAPYFHNGAIKTLREVVEFYVSRDNDWKKWYPVARKHRRKYDDLPARYVLNVNTSEAPYDRRPGDAPALDTTEIEDVVAFLKTLTDGYNP